MKLSRLSTHYRTLCSIALLSLALIACGGSDSSSETSADETSSAATTGVDSAGASSTGGGSTETSSTSDGSTSEPSVDSGPTPPADDSSLSTYVFFDGNERFGETCSSDGELSGSLAIFDRASMTLLGTVQISGGTIRLEISGASANGTFSCFANAGNTLSARGVRLSYEVSNFQFTFRLN